MIKVTGIIWDTEDNGEDMSQEELDLPSEVDIYEAIDIDDIADYLSDEYGYCVICFDVDDEEDIP